MNQVSIGEKSSQSTSLVLASFFKRLEGIEAITRLILSNAPISALLTFRGEPEKRVLLDYTRMPARISVDGEERTGTIQVTVRGDVMHEILLDRMPPGVAMGRREMLLRGSACNLAKFIPLFEFGPLLYKEHLTDLGLFGFHRPREISQPQEVAMNAQPEFKGEPVALVKLSPVEKILFAAMNALSYALGYVVGSVRYRLLKKLNLFDVLSSMSRGLAAAMPKGDVSEGASGK